MKYKTLELNLDEDTHPRRFLEISNQVFVYGGETGDLVRLDESGSKSTLVRQWDEDALRAVAVSPSQRIVVVGLDCGTTQVYHYKDVEINDRIHPFVDIPDASASTSQSLLSQSDTLTSPRPGDDMRVGPSFDTPVRHIVFLDDQYVAIASESTTVVWDVTDGNAALYFLEDKIRSAHDGVGCRALERISNKPRVFGALGLDGRMSYWDCSAEDQSRWALLHRESMLCVPRKDPGEIHGAEAWVRACRPVAGPITSSTPSTRVALPGDIFWKWRQLTSTDSKMKIEEHESDVVPDSHSNMILVAVPCGEKPMDQYWCSIGRDGRVILWELVSRFCRFTC